MCLWKIKKIKKLRHKQITQPHVNKTNRTTKLAQTDNQFLREKKKAWCNQIAFVENGISEHAKNSEYRSPRFSDRSLERTATTLLFKGFYDKRARP